MKNQYIYTTKSNTIIIKPIVYIAYYTVISLLHSIVLGNNNIKSYGNTKASVQFRQNAQYVCMCM